MQRRIALLRPAFDGAFVKRSETTSAMPLKSELRTPPRGYLLIPRSDLDKKCPFLLFLFFWTSKRKERAE